MTTGVRQLSDTGEMSFMEHLTELRKALIAALLGVVPCAIGAWVFREWLLEMLVQPLVKAWKARGMGEPTLHFANPVEPFVAYLKVAAIAGLVVAAPWVFWQLWRFIAPGLYPQERRFALPFTLASTVCFVGGVLFAYIVVFPLGFETFLSFSGMLPAGSLRLEPTLMISEYLSFVLRLLLAFGVVFEIPVVVFFLAFAGIVSARTLLNFGRWWVLVATLLAAMLTPPDVASQMLMLGPLIVLYYLSVGLAFLVQRKRAE